MNLFPPRALPPPHPKTKVGYPKISPPLSLHNRAEEYIIPPHPKTKVGYPKISPPSLLHNRAEEYIIPPPT